MSNEINMLQKKLYDHIEAFNAHVANEDMRWQHLIEMQEGNTNAIHELTVAITHQSEATKDMVAAWNAANGAVKVGAAVGRFIQWASSMAIIGAAAVWMWDRFLP